MTVYNRHYAYAALAGLCAAALLVLMPQEAMAQAYDVFGNYVGGGYSHHEPNLAPVRLALIAFFGAIGFGIGWFLSPQAAPFRKAVMAVMGLLLLLIIVLDNGLWGWGLTPFAALVAFMAGLGYWARSALQRFIAPPTTFGSAEWAGVTEIITSGLADERGFRIGQFIDDSGIEHEMYYDGDGHLLTIAPSRSHKGTSAIIPNLLSHIGSALIVDPKGENAMITAQHRAAMGQTVKIVDPWSTTGLETARFNPIDWLKAGDPSIGDNAMLLAEAIIVMSNGNEKFWDEEAKALLVGLLLFVALDPSEDGQRHLGRVRDLLLLDGDALKKLFKAMLNSSHSMVCSTGARCLQKEEKLLANVMASLQSHTHFLDSPHLRDSLSASDFDFADLKAALLSVYLVLPADKLVSHAAFLRMLVQMAITVTARNIETKPDHPILFMLDEMAALGRLSTVEQAFGLMAGYGMQIWGIVQNLSQLKCIYGDGWETFIANARVLQYFGSRDEMTAEYFSKICGVTTVWNFSTAIARAFGKSSGQGGVTSSSTHTTTETTSATQRRLAYADELMRMHPRKQVLLVENMNPIAGLKRPWFEDETLKELGVNLHKPVSQSAEIPELPHDEPDA